MFLGPRKFPTSKEIEEGLIVPETSIQAIQKVVVEACSMSPEEVAQELLLAEKTQNQTSEEHSAARV